MVGSSSSTRTSSVLARWRRIVATADRGWKATALGVAIVVATAVVL
ncbi:hypothetical protein [Haloarcula onubensis]|uniref:ABC transporter permease n=1 Tax=Haloarcula onubensis TaxID=2950539 RepID=A0ABU2FPQ1_9EURY|nr:hypothetical protein [Halomicroarcula sp. S3CR25-11]MDS0282738.1 hypothetical protein [Halomicroarcula sp. S3CR25-11]